MGFAVQEAVSRFKSDDWIAELESAVPREREQLSNADITILLERARKSLEKRQAQRATNWLALGLWLSESSVLARIRRAGVLRASKYGYQAHALTRSVGSLLARREMLPLASESVDYLASVSALLELSPAVHELHLRIVRELAERQHVALKSLVAVVDHRFLMQRPANRLLPSDDPGFQTQEDYAEALSLLVHLFATRIGINDAHFNWMDEAGIARGTYDAMLVSACKIKKYDEAEILIDAFGYRACPLKHQLRIVPSEARLEQSMRLGYIQADVQYLRSRLQARSERTDVPLLSELATSIFSAHGENLIRQLDQPVPRLVLGIPDAPESFELFRGDHFFREDLIYVETMAKEQFCRPGQLLAVTLDGGVTLGDVLKIQRLMNFLASLMEKRLRPLFDVGAEIAFRSLLPVFEAKHLRRVLERCVSSQAADAFLAASAYGGSKEEGVFDVQYQPLIRGSKFFLMPMNILSSSNLLRNMLYLHTAGRKAEDPDDRISMQALLSASLATRFECVAQNVNFRTAGNQFEADILVLIKKRLLVIECKASFHPCNLHELRTSYEHLITGAQQLDRLKAFRVPPVRWTVVSL